MQEESPGDYGEKSGEGNHRKRWLRGGELRGGGRFLEKREILSKRKDKRGGRGNALRKESEGRKGSTGE